MRRCINERGNGMTCGKETKDDSAYCPSLGSGTAPTEENAEAAAEMPKTDETGKVDLSANNETEAIGTQKHRKKGAFVLSGVAVICAAVLFVLVTNNIIPNPFKYAKGDAWSKYAPVFYAKDGNMMMEYDGEITVLNAKSEVYASKDGGKIYYLTDFEDGTGTLVCAKTKKPEETTVIDTDVEYFEMIETVLAYRKDSAAYIILDGEEQGRKIGEDIYNASISADEKAAVCLDEMGELFALDLKSGQKTKIADNVLTICARNAENSNVYIKSCDDIYYIDNDENVYYWDGKNRTKVDCGYVLFAGENDIFVKADENGVEAETDEYGLEENTYSLYLQKDGKSETIAENAEYVSAYNLFSKEDEWYYINRNGDVISPTTYGGPLYLKESDDGKAFGIIWCDYSDFSCTTCFYLTDGTLVSKEDGYCSFRFAHGGIYCLAEETLYKIEYDGERTELCANVSDCEMFGGRIVCLKTDGELYDVTNGKTIDSGVDGFGMAFDESEFDDFVESEE